jgi:hypothetical protein
MNKENKMKEIQPKKQNISKNGSEKEVAKIRSLLNEWADAVRGKTLTKFFLTT